MAVGKPEGSGGMVGGGPRGGFPGGAGRGTGRLRGVRKPSVRRTPRGGKKINDLTGKKKIYGDERGDWKMNLRQYNAFTPRTRRASVAKLSTYNEKTGNYAVAVNKNAPRTRAVVTAKNDAGTRTPSKRTTKTQYTALRKNPARARQYLSEVKLGRQLASTPRSKTKMNRAVKSAKTSLANANKKATSSKVRKNARSN
jgi:hypothetical protein